MSKPKSTIHKKELYTMIKLNLFQSHKNGSTYTNQCNTPDLKKRKSHDHLNRLKKKKKKSNKIQSASMTKTLIKVGIEGTHLNIMKAIEYLLQT